MSEEHLFNWHSASRGNRPIITAEVVRLWTACKRGRKVEVFSAYGKPPIGFRGMFFETCGCGYNFMHIQDSGFIITDKHGDQHLVDAMGLHLVACHSEKLDADEQALLQLLPDQELVDEAELREILRMDL